MIIGKGAEEIETFLALHEKERHRNVIDARTKGYRMLEIVDVKEYTGGIEKAIEYIHGVWGNAGNYDFYRDAIVHSSIEGRPLPRFFVMVEDGVIRGCCALITNDFISRHDLYPWLACLHVDEQLRGRGLGNLLMEHAEREARLSGFRAIYLTTDHDGYYERYGWTRIEDGYERSGRAARIYVKHLPDAGES